MNFLKNIKKSVSIVCAVIATFFIIYFLRLYVGPTNPIQNTYKPNKDQYIYVLINKNNIQEHLYITKLTAIEYKNNTIKIVDDKGVAVRTISNYDRISLGPQ